MRRVPEACIPVVLTVLGSAQIGRREHRLPAFQLRRVPKLNAVGGGLWQTDMCVPQHREGWRSPPLTGAAAAQETGIRAIALAKLTVERNWPKITDSYGGLFRRYGRYE